MNERDDVHLIIRRFDNLFFDFSLVWENHFLADCSPAASGQPGLAAALQASSASWRR